MTGNQGEDPRDQVEETAWHAGHLDIDRELIDSQTGLGSR